MSNEKASGPAIVHSGVMVVEESKIQGCRKRTTEPSATLPNEPEPVSTSAIVHDLIPAAAARLVVAFSPESWRMIPPSGEEEKLIEPEMNAAWIADVRAIKAIRHITGGDVVFMIVVMGGWKSRIPASEKACTQQGRAEQRRRSELGNRRSR